MERFHSDHKKIRDRECNIQMAHLAVFLVEQVVKQQEEDNDLKVFVCQLDTPPLPSVEKRLQEHFAKTDWRLEFTSRTTVRLFKEQERQLNLDF